MEKKIIKVNYLELSFFISFRLEDFFLDLYEQFRSSFKEKTKNKKFKITPYSLMVSFASLNLLQSSFLPLMYLILFIYLMLILHYLLLNKWKKTLVCLCASPIIDPQSLAMFVTLSKKSFYYATTLGSLYNCRLITPIANVKGYDIFITVGGIGISKSYLNSLLSLKLAVYFGADGKEKIGFWLSYGATPKMTEKRFLPSFVEILKSERIELTNRIAVLDNKLLEKELSEGERAASFISKEVYLRRLSDNEETLSLLNSYLAKMKKGESMLEWALPGNLGYSSTGGLGVSYNEHFLNVCLENKDLYNGAFRRFWQERDCQHFHGKGDLSCLTELRAKKFESTLETLNADSAIIPYSYNLIKVFEEFRNEVGYNPPKLTFEGKSYCQDPEGYLKAGNYLFAIKKKDELSSIWQDVMNEGSVFYDICIQDSLTPEYPLDLRVGLTLRAVGLFFFIGFSYLGNSSSIYFEGLCYKPVEVARDMYIREYTFFVESFLNIRFIYLKKEINYKIRLSGFGLSS